MKGILISIKPQYCELIASGKKTVEVRKTKPKFETPFKVYIYETQGRTETPFIDEEGHHIFKGRGQVIGEFVCDKIVEFRNKLYDSALEETSLLSCVDMYDLVRYIADKGIGYGWHISDLVIYDKPRELREFYTKGDCDGFGCPKCHWSSSSRYGEAYCDLGYDFKPIKRPPQSWCYVESEG